MSREDREDGGRVIATVKWQAHPRHSHIVDSMK